MNLPNDLVVKSEDTTWFSDPSYVVTVKFEGGIRESEIGANYLYCFDPKT